MEVQTLKSVRGAAWADESAPVKAARAMAAPPKGFGKCCTRRRVLEGFIGKKPGSGAVVANASSPRLFSRRVTPCEVDCSRTRHPQQRTGTLAVHCKLCLLKTGLAGSRSLFSKVHANAVRAISMMRDAVFAINSERFQRSIRCVTGERCWRIVRAPNRCPLAPCLRSGEPRCSA